MYSNDHDNILITFPLRLCLEILNNKDFCKPASSSPSPLGITDRPLWSTHRYKTEVTNDILTASSMMIMMNNTFYRV